MAIASATAILSMLEEGDLRMKGTALKGMDRLMDEHWPQFAEADLIRKLEMLHESDEVPFEDRQLASLVTSKIYYHLNSMEQALHCAMGAGSLLDVGTKTEYVRTILARSVDMYVGLRQEIVDKGNADQKPDARLEKLVNRLIQRCFDHKQFQQAVGIGLEARRLDIFKKAILDSKNMRVMLAYALRVAMTLVQNRHFRMQVFAILIELYRNLESPDFVHLFQCLICMDRSKDAAEVFLRLAEGDDQQKLTSYQLAFDLSENGTQQFRLKVIDHLKLMCEEDARFENAATKASVGKLHEILSGDLSIQLNLQFLIRSNHGDLRILKHMMKEVPRNSISHNAIVISNAFMHSGTTSDTFLRDNLDWLARATNWAKFTATASLGVIHRGHEKDAIKIMSTYLPRDAGGGSYAEGGGLYALGLIHANHGSEEIINYLKEQLTAANNEMLRHGGCLGLGLAAMTTQRADVYETLKNNLYQDDAITGEAAAIAMGLVMMGSASQSSIEDMIGYAHETQHEKILRGLAIGISLVMYERLEEADSLIETLMKDKDPIMRRAAMYTISMAYCGTGQNAAIRLLLHVAVSDTDNDVRRAAVMAIGFLLFAEPERCPVAVDLLSESYNPHVRYGAAMALAIACAGTGSREALRILEPMLTDAVNYVRQGAYVASAIILVQQNETAHKSKDFRARYRKAIDDKQTDVISKFGAIMAQGIIDAGGQNVTISMLTRTGHTSLPSVVGIFIFMQFWYWFPLTHFLALALTPTALIGLNRELKMPKVQFRSNANPKRFAYPQPMEEKKDKQKEKVETAVLSITHKQRKKDELKRLRQSRSTDEHMDVDEAKDASAATTTTSASSDTAEAKTTGTDVVMTETSSTADSARPTTKAVNASGQPSIVKPSGTARSTAEKSVAFSFTLDSNGDASGSMVQADSDTVEADKESEVLENPARVMNAQLRVMTFEGGRYRPLKPVATGGIIMLGDSTPEQQEDLVEALAPSGPAIEDGEEPQPPEPFVWSEEDDQ